jgi:hypothetical protein
VARVATGAIIVRTRKEFVLQPQRVQLLHPLRQGRVDQSANCRLGKGPVKGKIDLRNAGGCGEPALIGRVVTTECSDIVQSPCLTSHHPVSSNKIGIDRITGLVLKHGFVEAGRQGIDQIDIAGELAVLFLCNAPRNEDAKVTNSLMNRGGARLAFPLSTLPRRPQLNGTARFPA